MSWSQIKEQKDIDFLFDEYFGFHDSCICSADYKSGAKVDDGGTMYGIKSNDCALIIRFDSQMPSFHKQPEKTSLELKFSGLRRLNLIGYQENYFCHISSCYLAFYKKFIIWSDNDYFDLDNFQETKLLEEPMSTFVIADKMEWRFV